MMSRYVVTVNKLLTRRLTNECLTSRVHRPTPNTAPPDN